ncbi:MAG TPA: rhomboid family intramembrane serine protease [Chitinophagaceae bacterium]|nr:rhomboid family intramembrane serine protease [Chitinophagaceae bacterium]
MGESERYLDYKRKKISFGEDGNALTMLISINGVVFILLTFVKILYYLLQLAPGAFESNILPWFTMPARLSALAYRPWTFFSYMFTHTGLIVTLTNMLWLWVFGSVLQNIAGNRKLIPVYIYGGITGACVFIAANYLIPTLRSSIDVSTLEGANAAILSVAVATTALAPDHRFFKMLNGGIPLWVITLLYVIIDFAGIAGAGAAYHIAHLAGGFIGFMFVFNLRKGKDWSLWINELYNWFINLFNPDKIDSVKRKKEKIFYKTGNQKPFVKRSNITQQRIDEILDKINQHGYHLLTDEEKNILKRAGDADL